MAYIPNQQVYKVELHPIIAFYQYFQQYTILNPYNLTYTPATFQEDLERVLNVFNGRLSDEGLCEYAASTPYVDEYHPNATIINYCRQILIDQLYNEVLNRALIIFPTYLTEDEIFVAVEGNYLYFLDLRRQTYVPDTLSHLCRQTVSEPALDDDAWF